MTVEVDSMLQNLTLSGLVALGIILCAMIICLLAMVLSLTLDCWCTIGDLFHSHQPLIPAGSGAWPLRARRRCSDTNPLLPTAASDCHMDGEEELRFSNGTAERGVTSSTSTGWVVRLKEGSGVKHVRESDPEDELPFEFSMADAV